MKWHAVYRDTHGEIENDPKAGYYLYIFKNGEGIEDQLQDTLEIAKRCALEDYGIPLDSWQKDE